MHISCISHCINQLFTAFLHISKELGEFSSHSSFTFGHDECIKNICSGENQEFDFILSHLFNKTSLIIESLFRSYFIENFGTLDKILNAQSQAFLNKKSALRPPTLQLFTLDIVSLQDSIKDHLSTSEIKSSPKLTRNIETVYGLAIYLLITLLVSIFLK